jgi:hypothetical protein
MIMERTARLSATAAASVRIPNEFLWEGDDVVITRPRGRPAGPPRPVKMSMQELIESLRARGPRKPEDRFPEIEDLPLDR